MIVDADKELEFCTRDGSATAPKGLLLTVANEELTEALLPCSLDALEARAWGLML